MTAEEVAGLLVCGTLPADACPELADAEFATEVDQRLAAVGLVRALGSGRWVARRREPDEAPPGFEPFHRLHQAHLALLAAVYLHLVYLPTQAGVTPADDATISFDELATTFSGYKRRKVQAWVSELRRSGHLGGEGDAIAAGPLLAAIDPVVAEERAEQAVRSYLVRRNVRDRLGEERDAED